MSETTWLRCVAAFAGGVLSAVAARVGYLIGLEHLLMGWAAGVCGVLGVACIVSALISED